jgi:hypothetical protein
MENICCVCLEKTEKVTNCNHHLCKTCYSNMYTKNCPLCRKKIDETSYVETEEIEEETDDNDTSDEEIIELMNQMLAQRLHEVASNLAFSQITSDDLDE